MIVNQKIIEKGLSRLKREMSLEARARKYSYEQPLRSELFSIKQLERHAVSLAKWHEVDPNPNHDKLLERLAENEEILLQVYELLTKAADGHQHTAPAAFWLLDNFYKIEEQIRTARRHLPKSYSRQLPHLMKGPLAGFPRAYDLARELVLHLDGQIDAESLRRFIDAYQTLRVLSIGEIWAIPIMLRLALIENLRRVSIRIALNEMDRVQADRWADRIVEAAEKDPKSVIMVVADMAESDPPMSSAFVAEMFRRLQGQSLVLEVPLKWMEERLSEIGLTVEQSVQSGVQQDAADRVSIGNSIESFRLVDSMDWRSFVEEASLVERTLRMDPARVYGKMDFATRDRYRHIVEKLAKRSPLSEVEVAKKALDLAEENANEAENDEKRSHVGFYLVDRGIYALEEAVQAKRSLLKAAAQSHRLFYYLGSIYLITFLIIAAVLITAYRSGLGLMPAFLAGIPLIFSASSLAIFLVNWAVTMAVKPSALPRMDFSKGFPPEYRTLVVVPALLTSIQGIDHLLETLEIRYLANQDPNLCFGLLTDFRDASNEEMPEDQELLSQASQGILALRQRYPEGRFFLFHRPRRWNPQEKAWMGYERKRGSIEDLNSLLRGGPRERFSLIIGDELLLPGVKYVITLDEDTLMPRGSANLLVGNMAHPLNAPRYDGKKQCVTEGYSILQPLLALGLPQAGTSRFMKIFGIEPGVDPYTREVSDVYQDLFGEGSFAGKGIYDVDAFARTLSGRLPENLILSHDLLEGCYARAALVSDVQFYEEFPHSYATDTVRRHRWIRGDWQISTWLLRRVPGPSCSTLPNPLSYLSKWKVIDNLRRSLVPLAQILLLILGWTVLLRPVFWTFVVVGLLLVPPLIHFTADLLRKPSEMPLDLHLRCSFRSAKKSFAQVGLSLIFLPYEAFFSLDAVARTCFRLIFSRQGLLEWRTSRDSKRSTRGDLREFYRMMWPAPLFSAIAGIYLILFHPQSLYIAGIFLVLWFLSPYIAWWISQPLMPAKAELTKEQKVFLHKLSRRTWRFFETFVGPENNWLPPDNYQEEPRSIVANGTSPTNMGLSLLANLGAYDFGYVSLGRMMDRLSKTILVMEGLERFRGHFYNWYDTKLLKPLCPLYISTVDSGNLVGHLLILGQGLMEIPDQKIFPPQAISGLKDTLSLLLDAASGADGGKDSGLKARAPEKAISTLEELAEDLRSYPNSLVGARDLLERLSNAMNGLMNSFEDKETNSWAQAFILQINDFKEDLSLLTPWASLLPLSEGELKISDEAREELQSLDRIPNIREVAELGSGLLPAIDQILSCPENQCKEDERMAQLRQLILDASHNASKRISALEELAERYIALSDIEYDFLFDRSRNLLAIGYNVQDLRRDASCYDLLASEARLTSFVAISHGILPQDHWFSLGRLMTTANGELVLLSWGGTMFEYLMPLLVMPSYENTLLDQTYRIVVKRHIEYGKLRGVPWGISESGYSMTDANLIYQYRAFGVPGLGFKRGLTEDLVIAPYASALALMVAPDVACSNLQQMAKDGYLGPYGFYEAVDFTPSRLPRDQSSTIVQSFMAHHQGMTFLSLLYVLRDRSMQRRFLSNPLFKATELLLQEKISRAAPFYPHAAEVSAPLWRVGMWEEKETTRAFDTPDTPMPEVHLLSNGRYSVMVTNAGGGYSRWKDIAITRWHADPTCDSYGTFIYIRDLESGEFWSAGYQPTLKDPDVYTASFQESLARFWRQDNNIDSQVEIVVSPEDDIELRSLKITNRSWDRREIELTSYAEVVLADPASDASHPAFSKLFVETEIIPSRRAILCHRRPRSREEKNPWMFHLLITGEVGDVSYETDRAKFLGRGRSAADPDALRGSSSLSGSDGPVLDPVIAIRCRLAVEPGEAVNLNFITGIADTREACVQLIEKYQDIRMAERISDMAWTHGQMILRQLNVTEEEVLRYEHLASAIIYPTYTWRASPSVLMSNTSGQSGLWGYGISGDHPIVLLRIGDRSNISLARQLILAHAYWRLMGLTVDLLIWNEDSSDYRQLLQDEIMGLIASSPEAALLDRPGGIFVRRVEQISDEAKILMQTVARAIITDSLGGLEDQLDLRFCPVINIPPLEIRRMPYERPYEGPYKEPSRELEAGAKARGKGLVYWNDLGGFTPDGREYIIKIPPKAATPAPWVNVIANPGFGSIVSESGGSCTWSENAHEFRLTPWYNDPVTDISGEALYIRDEDTGRFWSPTAFPARGSSSYICRHGFGYSVFEHNERGIRSELWTYVAVDAPVKLMVLRLRNESNRPRRLSATCYLELVLGELHSRNAMYIITEIDARTGALLAKNTYNREFPDRVVFLDTNVTSRSFTGDRTEFLGRNGTLSNPLALTRTRLSGRVGAALDPCAACQVKFDLAEGEEREIIFTCGMGKDRNDARSLVQRFRGSGPARMALEAVWNYWNRTLGVVYVETEDKALNILTNGWLLYQTLSSRLFARAGYYQSSGAYGFRDQLQDTMALLFADPGRTREHILRCASRQFIEGDVQHWWHPQTGRGIRTRISDDYLWLPYVAYQYISVTGDTGVLDERIQFLEGRPLKPEEDSYFDLPCVSEKAGTLYEHCKRSIEWGLKFGPHGLPLMGSGDWNDGMNRVGFPGKGESVWLALFLYDVLVKFFDVAVRRGDRPFSELCVSEAAKLKKNIEDHGWDGDWYLRAYFDDGRPLGSLINTECKIDSLPQSWSVLSGASDPERARMAMDALDRLLVRRDSALIQLLDPPFDVSDLDPGYIKGYIPGVRENGGQYTHAAIWAVMAFAQMGDCRKAWELLSLINPVNHGSTLEAISTYKVEPYVVAADVYSVPPHTGRGGWTWYTGAASWMYRLIVEFLLGLRREVNALRFEPCLPPEWKSFKLHYRHYETFYHITVNQVVTGSPVTSVTVDGAVQDDLTIHLVDDRKEHFVEVRMG